MSTDHLPVYLASALTRHAALIWPIRDSGSKLLLTLQVMASTRLTLDHLLMHMEVPSRRTYLWFIARDSPAGQSFGQGPVITALLQCQRRLPSLPVLRLAGTRKALLLFSLLRLLDLLRAPDHRQNGVRSQSAHRL